MPGGCTMFMATSGNGVGIKIRSKIQTVFCVAARSAIMLRSLLPPIAATSSRTTVATSLVSVLGGLYRLSPLLLYHSPKAGKNLKIENPVPELDAVSPN